MKDIFKVYNRTPEREIDAQPLSKDLQYKSVLAREIPYKYGPSDSRYDPDLCSWCQENQRIRADPDVITWCERCYILHFKKHNGEYIQHKTIPIYKQLLKDAAAGKIKPEAWQETGNKRIDE